MIPVDVFDRVYMNIPRLSDLCVKSLVTHTWSFSILNNNSLLPSDIHNDLVYGWSWKWLLLCHAFFKRLEKSTVRYKKAKWYHSHRLLTSRYLTAKVKYVRRRIEQLNSRSYPYTDRQGDTHRRLTPLELEAIVPTPSEALLARVANYNVAEGWFPPIPFNDA